MRVLMWILGRANGTADAVETPVGYEPRPEDINIEGLDITEETVRGLLDVDVALWKEEAAGIREFYKKFGDKLPDEMAKQLDALEERLGK